MNIFSQLISAQLEVLAADPTAGLAPGRVYFNSVTACPRFYDGVRWVQETFSGKIALSASSASAPGWIQLTGSVGTPQSVSKTTYPTLFAALGYQYGGAADSFTLPPAPGRAIVATGSGTGLTTRNLGDLFGEETHLLTTAEMPSHSHGVTDPGHTHTLVSGGSVTTDGTGGGLAGGGAFGPISSIASHTTGISINNTGGGTAHNNLQPSIAFNAFIKI